MCNLIKKYCNRCRTETGEQPQWICHTPEKCRERYDLRWVASLNHCVRCRDLETANARWRPAEEDELAEQDGLASLAGVTGQGGQSAADPAPARSVAPPPPPTQQASDGMPLPAPVFPPMQPLQCRGDDRRRYRAPARPHPLAQQLATLGILEPEEWELWRSNTCWGGSRNALIGAEGRLQKARMQRPGWQLPYPYEGFDDFRYRQDRNNNRTDLNVMMQQFLWRNANDQTLRPVQVQREKHRKAQGVVPGGLGGANFRGGEGGDGDRGGPGGAATGLGMAS